MKIVKVGETKMPIELEFIYLKKEDSEGNLVYGWELVEESRLAAKKLIEEILK